MTSTTLHQIADLIARLARLEALVRLDEIETEDLLAELARIRGEIYRIAMESRDS